ncbi:MAG: ABC transporter permease [Acidobacteria bacterium]|nr:ABC transporter permease [Acidobacteriota bacterium]
MKFFALIWRNMARKKVRTTLTIGSYAVALFLFGLLATIQTAFNQGVDVAGADRLVTRNKISLIMPLPVAYKERMLQLPGVKEVTYASWFGGKYQDDKNFFPQFAIDTDTWLRVYPEFKVPPAQWSAFLADREGCVIGQATAAKYGFKIGDRVPIIATIFGGVWEFNVDGIYTGHRQEDDVTQFWFHGAYLEERRQWGKGMVGWYVIRVKDPDRAIYVSKAIDDRFANSSWETKTETESAFASGFVKQMGNIKLLILVIGTVVFFTLLLVTGNTMAMAVRERTGELAVLKTIGFRNGTVLWLVLAESLGYAIQGGVIGLAAVKLYTLRGDPTGGMLPLFYLSAGKMALGLAVTLALGAAAGIIPAWLAMRLRIVEALRRV